MNQEADTRQWLFDNRPDLASLVSRFEEAIEILPQFSHRDTVALLHDVSCNAGILYSAYSAQPGRGERRLLSLLRGYRTFTLSVHETHETMLFSPFPHALMCSCAQAKRPLSNPPVSSVSVSD